MTKTITIYKKQYSIEPITIDSNFADAVDAINDNTSEECHSCPLQPYEVNKDFVKASGYPRARIMLVGMNPSNTRRGNLVFGPEDSVNYPIVKKMLDAVGLTFDNVYITNILKCSTIDNELDKQIVPKCIANKFIRELEIVDPELIICLGKEVSKLFGLERFDENVHTNGSYLVATAYHPSFYARKGGEGAEGNISHLWQTIKNIKLKNFVNLHVHNEFSIRDGIGTAEEHIMWALKHKAPAVSLTNHGNISVFFKQYEAAKKVGIKPIFGVEAYMIADREKLMPWIGSKEEGATEQRKIHGNPRHHILLIAKNYTGLKNLFKITSLAFIESFYRFPLIDFKLLSENKEGIIVSTACAGGELNRFIEQDKMDEAREYIKKYKAEFGDDFYIEMMSMDYKHQWMLNRKLWQLSKEFGVKTIVTTDAHYLYPEDQKVHEAILLLQTKKSYTEKEETQSDDEMQEEEATESENEKLWEFVVKDLYLKTFDQIMSDWQNGKWFGDNPPEDQKVAVAEAIKGTYEVFSKVEKFDLDKTLKIPQLYEDGAKVLYEKVAEGLKTRIIDQNRLPEYKARCRKEYDTIIKLGFVDYFLILEDMIKWTKEKFGRYEVGAGRGSAAGSLINYLLGITDIDPIKHVLLFERFLDEGRKDLPDVDIDFSPQVRDLVKEYLIGKYGADKVATIGNYHIGKVKGCIKDAARIYNLDYFEVNEITKDLPFTIYTQEGKKEQLDNMSYEYIVAHFPKVKKFFEKNPQVEALYKRLRNSIKATGRHAAGVVVSGVTLYDWIPLIRSKEFIVTANTEGGDYHELTGQGFVKFDILGLNNLAVVNDTMRLVKKRYDIDIDWDKIDIDSKEAYALARKGDLFGVFQFESPLAFKTIVDVKPENFDDLSAINAIIRPGPLDMGMNVEFAKRKAAGNWRELTHESYADYLKGTYGIVVYQEDFMRLFKELGEFDVVEVNKSRKDLVKYERSTKYETARLKRVDSWADKFITNASKKMPPEIAKELWEQIRAFSRYAFNKSHSDSYTYTSFRELWLKAHYGIEFYTALLNNTARSKEDKYGISTIAKYISRIQTSAIYYEKEADKFAKRDKVKILPVDINKSDFEFSIDEDFNIRFGLTFVKGITPDAAAEIIRRRPFASISDFIDSDHKQLKNKRVITALIKSGALDSIAGGISRSEMYNAFIKIRKYKEDPVSWSLSDIISNEIELMNVSFTEVGYFSGQRDRVKDKYPDLKLQMLEDALELGEECELLALFRISAVEKKKSKKGKPYYVVGLSDGVSSLNRVYYWGDKDVQEDEQKFDIMDTNNLYIGKLQKSNSYNQLRQIKLIDKISR